MTDKVDAGEPASPAASAQKAQLGPQERQAQQRQAQQEEEARDVAQVASGAGRAPVADPDATPPPITVAAAAAESDVIELDALEPVGEPAGQTTAVGVATSPGARAFAIADAIRLLQSLPVAPRADMVARLVRVTLGPVNVSVEDLSRELSRQMQALERQVRFTQAELAALENRLQGKRAALAVQQGERNQLAQVKARLHMASRPAPHRPPPIPRDAVKATQFPQPVSAPAE